MSTTTTILNITASARTTGSKTRALADDVLAEYAAAGETTVISRNVAAGLPFVDEDWVGANFTHEAERTPDQRAKLMVSDSLVAELEAADVVVIGLPVYNFGVPASLKAWIDMVARVGKTFRYTSSGPVGLLTGKKAIIAMASGGTKYGSAIDFATPYLKHALSFIGIQDVTVLVADEADATDIAAAAGTLHNAQAA